MVTVLVTGGSGFIGSHVAGAYLSRGHRVVVADDFSSGRRVLAPQGAEVHEVDIRSPALAELFERVRPDIVNHHAGQISVTHSVRDPQLDAGINVSGTINVLENAVRVGSSRFICASTGGALYGEPEYTPCDEKHPIAPLSPYGVSKYCAEQYVRYYSHTAGLSSVVLRYGNVYGPGQDPHGEAGVVAIFSQRMLSGEQAVIFGNGLQERDFVFVGDVAAANVAALSLGDGETLNIGTGEGHSVNELYSAIAEATDCDLPPVHEEARPGEVFRITLDASRAQKVLGWRPKTSFRDGIQRTVEAFAAESSQGR